MLYHVICKWQVCFQFFISSSVARRSRLPFRDSDAVLSRLPRGFVDFLAETETKEDIEYGQQVLNQLEAHSAVVRQARLDSMARNRDRLSSAVETHLNRIKLTNQRLDQV